MTEDKIATIAYHVDEFIVSMAERSEIDPLTLCSIILARIALANDYAGTGEEFRKLLQEVIAYPPRAVEGVH